MKENFKCGHAFDCDALMRNTRAKTPEKDPEALEGLGELISLD